VGTVLAVTAATVLSLLPAVLPRTSATQAVLTGTLAAIAIGIAGFIRVLLRRSGIDVESRYGQHLVPVLLVCGFAVVAATVNASHWQSGLHAAMGMAPVGPDYWLRAAVGTAVGAGLVVGVLRGLRWVVQRLSGVRATRGRREHPRPGQGEPGAEEAGGEGAEVVSSGAVLADAVPAVAAYGADRAGAD
jgi:uncharacterized membrane protein